MNFNFEQIFHKLVELFCLIPNTWIYSIYAKVHISIKGENLVKKTLIGWKIPNERIDLISRILQVWLISWKLVPTKHIRKLTIHKNRKIWFL